MANLETLYRKIEDFQAQQRPEIKAHYQCKNGCSRCCYTDLSVFEVEKKLIEKWIQNLAPETRIALENKWKNPAKSGACAFLREESCTIYEARPLICRTQGLAMFFKENEQSYVDICPLNESVLNEISRNEVLDLDRLNQVLAQLELQDSAGIKRDRVRLAKMIVDF